MRVSVETTEGLGRKMTVAVPQEKVDSLVDTRLQEAARKMRLNGFRKGKVPIKVVRERFGEDVRQEVLNRLMRQGWYDAVAQEALEPASPPVIRIKDDSDNAAEVEFLMEFEVYPEVSPPDFADIELERLQAEVKESDIDEMVETLRQQRLSWHPVTRPPAKGDRVNIDCDAKLTRKTPGDAEEMKDASLKGADLELGSGRMIPGFEDGIIGKAIGKTFSLALTFPEDYHNPKAAGKAVEFTITLNSVSEPRLPELNEAFYNSFGLQEGGEKAFRREVAGNMEREMKQAGRKALRAQVESALLSKADFPVPEGIVNLEINSLRETLMARTGRDRETALEALPDALLEEPAKRKVRLHLIMKEVMRRQNIKADPGKVREAVEELASTYESPEEVIAWCYSDKEQLGRIEASVVEEQIVDAIIDQARISERQVSYQEFMELARAEGNPFAPISAKGDPK